MSANDLNLLQAITSTGSDSYSWAAKRAVRSVLAILRETPEGNPMWQPIYDAIVADYGLIADWGDENPHSADGHTS